MNLTRPLRRRRAAVGAAAVLASIVLASPLIDLAVTGRAEGKVSEAFREASGAQQDPKVSVHGFPVLLQVAHGRLDRVDISAQDIPADAGRALPITRLDMRLHGLTAPADASAARSQEATADAYLSYDDLSDALGLRVGPAASPGRIQGSLPLPLGQTADVSAAVAAGPGNTVTFEQVKITGTSLPEGLQDLLTTTFEQPIPLKNIPSGLHLTSLTADERGLQGHFEGQDVAFPPPATA
ncbi:LmeA family phospholipid-binding protein [Streptomyces rubiginosohelvolus]